MSPPILSYFWTKQEVEKVSHNDVFYTMTFILCFAAPLGTTLSGVIERHQKTILLTVSMSEVVLMPIVILAVFSGVCSLLTPFVYYRFLSFRYASRRNPYTRQTFRLFRTGLEQVTYLPACPAFVRNGVKSIIDIICRLAPPTVPQAN